MNEEAIDELRATMTGALRKMQKLCEVEKVHFLPLTKIFLQSVISTAADLAEATEPNTGTVLYADVEAFAKHGGISFIEELQRKFGGLEYSVSDIEPGDVAMAMNYLGQQLSTDLFKHLNELPESMRNHEMLLRAVEALLTNLLNQKFNSSHEILDNFCEHVHMCLRDLEKRQQDAH
ncbi:hypothetical protein E6Q11_04130 [Candidatus Dojkabacteria bacterium]|uniref:Uncharacterized protein n=1 Tax=Candidatus Dojkabacteria bacterium TaxID=2099670 RepID=A0A5C7J753_9BACT|nr:MAG: hypothetical protein E6Q11_04130 [Candidatus Dojkabacteria bacterium]